MCTVLLIEVKLCMVRDRLKSMHLHKYMPSAYVIPNCTTISTCQVKQNFSVAIIYCLVT